MARIPACLTALALAANMVMLPVHAQSAISELSAVSALPLASVVVASGVSTVAQASAQVLAAGATLVVRAVESTARGTVYVLERLSDGVRVSVEVGSQVTGAASMAVGTAVTVSAITAGLILSVAGEAIAFIPNVIGRALLHNQRLTN